MKSLYKSLLTLAIMLIGSISFAQTPVFNSNASAIPTIYLDFDGHVVTGTSWNYNGDISCAPSGLSNSQIIEIYNRIAEDYRPFVINVTTDSSKYTLAPADKRMRVVFTTSYAWYGNNAGGVAYTGSFSWGDNTPCFIFTSLLNYNTKNIAEAGSHEPGHTLGLRHQASYDANCNLVSAYNYGVGNGEISWAPIMGVGYNRNVTTWHNGPNPYGCANAQDDIGIITTYNDIDIVTDDHEETFNKATTGSFVNNKINFDGNITTSDDLDMFKFTLSGSRKINVSALPASVGDGDAGSNLDLQVQLYNGAKQLINTYNPAQTLSVAFDTVLSAGTYYALMDAVGNQYVSDYGSLGSYSLSIEQAPLATLPVHRLNLTGITENGYHKLQWNIEADEQVLKQQVEISYNGKDFTTLSDIEASNRLFQFHSETMGVVYYRIKITFDNLQQYFTNVIAMRSTGVESRPRLITNLIANHMILINSPSSYTYTINDMNGHIVSKGKINAGSTSINLQAVAGGTYIIRFDRGNDQYVDKFLIQ